MKGEPELPFLVYTYVIYREGTMDRRIETRVIDTAGAATTTLIQKNAADIWWITVSPETLGTAGVIKIYDGFDAAGRSKWQLESGYGLTHNFIPPIPCDQGIYITTDEKIASYTLAYRPRGWPRPKK